MIVQFGLFNIRLYPPSPLAGDYMQKSLFLKEYRVFLEHLIGARAEAGVTQIQLAKRMNVTQSFISKCERGERRLDLLELRAWCRALGIPFTAFVANFDRTTKKLM